jgi:hypothetical protein
VKLVKLHQTLSERDSLALFSPLAQFSRQPAGGKRFVHWIDDDDPSSVGLARAFDDAVRNGAEFGTLASLRLVELWQRWLSLPDADKDAGYPNVKQTVEVLKRVFVRAKKGPGA